MLVLLRVFLNIIFFFIILIPAYSKNNISNAINITDISLELKRGITRSIVLGASKSYNSDSAKDYWGKVSVFYNNGFSVIDAIKANIYVLVYNEELKVRDKNERFSILTGKLLYKNVFYGEKKQIEIFIHPSSLKRYGKVKAVRVVLSIGGKDFSLEKYYFKKNERFNDVKWYEHYKILDNELLNKFFTPFLYDSDNSSDFLKVL